MKRPMMFFTSGDCPCTPSPLHCDPPCTPFVGVTLSDDRYYGLATSAEGQLLLVPKGSNSQHFLKGSAGLVGFVIYEDEVVRIKVNPSINLPFMNPAVSGSYPLPGAFPFIVVGSGNPMQWRQLAAPSTGTYILESVNGSWVLAPGGTIPGLNTIGASPETVLKGGVMMIIEDPDNAGTYLVRRLAVIDKRVIVGNVDADTGEQTYGPLSSVVALTHPMGNFPKLYFRTFESLDADGNLISGGLEQAVVTGFGAVTDGIRMWYSPTTRRIYRAPAATHTFSSIGSSATATPPVSYTAPPGGHGAGSSAVYNYPDVRIDATFMFTADESFTMGLYRDDVLLHEFVNNATIDTFTIFYVDSACPPGSHTYSCKWKKNSGTNAVTIRQSLIMTMTLSA